MSMPKLCALIGIVFTIAGTLLVSWFDMVTPFDGQTHVITSPTGFGTKLHATPKYALWERRRRGAICWGSALILLGATLTSAPTLFM
jgi:hypothetical protein